LIIAADVDSAELRVVAALAQDKTWLEIFAKGQKPHIQTSAELFGKPQAKGSEEYTFTKSLTYRYIYLLPGKYPEAAGQLRMSKVDLSSEQIAQLTRRLDRAHPAIALWKHKVIAELHRTKRAKNVFGRFRDMRWALLANSRELREHAEQASLNFAVQTVVGKVINQATLRVAAELAKLRANSSFAGWLCLQCHDELGIYTPYEAEVPLAAKLLRSAIEQPIPELGGIIIPAEPKAGPTWGTMEELK
jgi:DNA polymerase I